MQKWPVLFIMAGCISIQPSIVVNGWQTPGSLHRPHAHQTQCKTLSLSFEPELELELSENWWDVLSTSHNPIVSVLVQILNSSATVVEHWASPWILGRLTEFCTWMKSDLSHSGDHLRMIRQPVSQKPYGRFTNAYSGSALKLLQQAPPHPQRDSTSACGGSTASCFPRWESDELVGSWKAIFRPDYRHFENDLNAVSLLSIKP